MAREELPRSTPRAPLRDVGCLDYMPTSFEVAMYQVRIGLSQMGVQVICSRGEARPEYFGCFSPMREVGFLIKESFDVPGFIHVELDHRQEWRGPEILLVTIDRVIDEIKEVLGYY